MTAPPIFDLPALGFNQTDFDLIVPGQVNQMVGRRTETRVHGTPFWRASYQIVPLARAHAGRADAWIRKVASRGGVFRAYDVSRPRPVEAGLTPVAWTPSITTITDARTIVLAGVGNDFQFREGDNVAFKMTDYVVSLHSIAADVQADGTGAVTLSIDPGLDSQHFDDEADVIFEKPYCLMQPTGWSNTKPLFGPTPSFSAQEVFFYVPEEE